MCRSAGPSELGGRRGCVQWTSCRFQLRSPLLSRAAAAVDQAHRTLIPLDRDQVRLGIFRRPGSDSIDSYKRVAPKVSRGGGRACQLSRASPAALWRAPRSDSYRAACFAPARF
jgi:hypothetical protein